MKAIAIVSGGLDSITMAYLLKRREYELHLISFDYGQRHSKEILSAVEAAEALESRHSVVYIQDVGRHLYGSALTSNIPVPEGHYAADNMKLTVVPNRNAIMINIAWGVAVAEGAHLVATAVHQGDHTVYPDCRPHFITAMDAALKLATEGFAHPELHLEAPFVRHSKADIVQLGHTVRVPFEKTWSCYKGLDRHCGKCGTCVERKEAFQIAGIPDPTEYMTEEENKAQGALKI